MTPEETVDETTTEATEREELLADALVEDVSIDGMCGVY
ncbi:mycofactocin precursor [Phycicoccus sp. HDW14]|nr:mycofactocin precursor MftA [Phycicoccus sp. HDW14]QIM20100.1 mycofactocin precursor [Phycicoccus sp. HDW14]